MFHVFVQKPQLRDSQLNDYSSDSYVRLSANRIMNQQYIAVQECSSRRIRADMSTRRKQCTRFPSSTILAVLCVMLLFGLYSNNRKR